MPNAWGGWHRIQSTQTDRTGWHQIEHQDGCHRKNARVAVTQQVRGWVVPPTDRQNQPRWVAPNKCWGVFHQVKQQVCWNQLKQRDGWHQNRPKRGWYQICPKRAGGTNSNNKVGGTKKTRESNHLGGWDLIGSRWLTTRWVAPNVPHQMCPTKCAKYGGWTQISSSERSRASGLNQTT